MGGLPSELSPVPWADLGGAAPRAMGWGSQDVLSNRKGFQENIAILEMERPATHHPLKPVDPGDGDIQPPNNHPSWTPLDHVFGGPTHFWFCRWGRPSEQKDPSDTPCEDFTLRTL